jgi:uncharacterized protein
MPLAVAETEMREEIDVALKDATLAQDRRRMNTLRLIKATIKDRDMAAREGGGDYVSDQEVLAILSKMIRQRLESTKLYEEDGRPELAAEEREEIAIIKSFLPKQLSEHEMSDVCAQAIKTTGAQSLRDMGKCMAELKARYPGQMDFSKAIRIVKSRLQ